MQHVSDAVLFPRWDDARVTTRHVRPGDGGQVTR